MERQIKHFTNDLIDKLIVDSKLSTNSLSIRIPFSYALKLVNINWNDILFAISNEYFDKDSAIEYAITLLAEGTDDENIITLAILNSSEITKEELLQKFIVNLAYKETEKEKLEAKDKIMYILLDLLYNNKEVFEDPLRAVEVVYDNFGFPKIIEKFVRYMPLENDESIGSEEKIYNSWENYLSDQKIRFSTT